MISGSSLSSGTTSSTKRGTVGGGGGARGVIAAFLALEKNLNYTQNKLLLIFVEVANRQHMLCYIETIFFNQFLHMNLNIF